MNIHTGHASKAPHRFIMLLLCPTLACHQLPSLLNNNDHSLVASAAGTAGASLPVGDNVPSAQNTLPLLLAYVHALVLRWQIGQQAFCLSHTSTQSRWKWWQQGRVRSTTPSATSSKQMVQRLRPPVAGGAALLGESPSGPGSGLAVVRTGASAGGSVATWGCSYAGARSVRFGWAGVSKQAGCRTP